MARLVSIDYNPLRRAASLEYESKAAGDTSKRIDLTRQSLSNQVWQNEINKRKIAVQGQKIREQEEREAANKFWTGMGGAVKIAGGVALGVLSGGALALEGIGLGLSGLNDLGYSAGVYGEEAYSGIAGIISTGIQVARQIHTYKSQLAEQGADTDVAKVMAGQIARGAARWSVEDGALRINRNEAVNAAIGEIDKKYGSGAGEKAFNRWEARQMGAGANQYANQAQAMGQQVIDNSLSQYRNGVTTVEGVYDTLAGMGLDTASTASAIAGAAREMYAYNMENAAVADRTGNREAAVKYRAEALKASQKAAAYLPSIKDYKDSGYGGNDALGLYRNSVAETGLTVDPEGRVTGIGLPENEKKKIEAKAADAARLQKEQLKTETKQVFDETVKAGGAITGARDEALARIVTGDDGVREAVTAHVYGLQQEELRKRFDADFLLGDDPYKIREMLENYKPGGAFSGDYKGFEGLQGRHYDQIKARADRQENEVKRVLKEQENLKIKENKERIKARGCRRRRPTTNGGRGLRTAVRPLTLF